MDPLEAVEAALVARGLTVVRRSTGARIDETTDILLGDTIVEMGLYLRLTDIVFVGKSLTGEGGQNPLEPAVLETAILTGKQVQNFRDTYRKLIDSGGAKIIRDGDMLAGAVSFLLANDAVRENMIRRGAATVEEMGGALMRTIAALDSFIQPLIVKAKLESVGGERRQGERRGGVVDMNVSDRRKEDRRIG